jgi:hypothetical protein
MMIKRQTNIGINIMTKNKLKLEIISSNSNPKIWSVYINDHRITERQTKPMGGGVTLRKFEIDKKDLLEALNE